MVDTAAALLEETGGILVIPAALLRQEHRDEIFGALAARGIPVRHVLLHAGETILRDADQQPRRTPRRAEAATARAPGAWTTWPPTTARCPG